MKHNLIALTDSYKLSQYNQLPSDTETIYSYMEARGGQFYKIVFFGLQYYLKEYLSKPITMDDIDDAEERASFHGMPFNRVGWERIVNVFNGRLPITIKAIPEQELYNIGDVLMTIENNDPESFWLTSYLETLLMKVWYPTTVATKSYYVKEIIKGAYEKSSDNTDTSFTFHNFGDRGSTCVESAMIGGMAHLTQFSGTDNFNAVKALKDYYGIERGFSIPATEHSTITSWGRENEYSAILNFIETYRNKPIIACVMDSYDIYKSVDFFTRGEMKAKIESDDYPVLVLRPDSGNPIGVLDEILKIMENNQVNYTVNSKGYKVFNKYRLIWGDGITPKQLNAILNFVVTSGYSAENIAFGSGGDLMQNVNRDTHGFAIKCSAIKRSGKWYDVYKDPITDKGKTSKKGRFDNKNLKVVFKDGDLV